MRYTVLQSAKKTFKKTFITLTAAVLSFSAATPLLLSASANAVAATNAYNTIPGVLAGSYPSLGYEATATSEFGDFVQLSSTSGRYAEDVSINFTSWTCGNDFAKVGGNWVDTRADNAECITDATTGSSYAHDITLNVYNVGGTVSSPTVGSLITTVTKSVNVPFRPSHDSRCDAYGGSVATDIPFGGMWFDDATNTCVHGKDFTATFSLANPGNYLKLPDNIIVTAAFNTSDYGTAPTHQTGPYDSLNFSVPNVHPSQGTDPNADAVFWKTVSTGNVLKEDTGWTGNVPLLQVRTVKDTEGPNLHLNPAIASPVQSGSNETLTADDAVSGVKNVSLKVYTILNPFTPIKNCSANAASVNCDLTTLANGHYRVVASATDKATPANTTTEQYDLVVDHTAPTLSIVSPTNNQWVGDSFNVSGIAADLLGSGVKQVNYSVENTSVSGTASGTNFWNFPVSGLTEGTYTITVTAVDNAGNTRTNHVTVHVDATKPDITFTNPLDFSKPFMTGPNFSIHSTDNSGSGIFASSVAIYHQDTTVAKSCLPSFSSNASCNATSLPEGEYYVTGSAVDNAGNLNTVSKNFTIDKTPPVVTVTAQTSTTGLPTVSGTVDDPTATVDVTVNGHTYSAVVNGNSWTAQVTNLLNNGSYDVDAVATDQAGNTSTDSTLDELTVAVPVATSSTNTVITVASIVGTKTATSGSSSNGTGTTGNAGSTGDQTGEVLGASSGVSSAHTTKKKHIVKGTAVVQTSNNFLGLGWWWLAVLAAVAALTYLVVVRRSEMK